MFAPPAEARSLVRATAAEFVRNGSRVIIKDVQDDLDRAVVGLVCAVAGVNAISPS